jgi:hypothetical protein
MGFIIKAKAIILLFGLYYGATIRPGDFPNAVWHSDDLCYLMTDVRDSQCAWDTPTMAIIDARLRNEQTC